MTSSEITRVRDATREKRVSNFAAGDHKSYSLTPTYTATQASMIRAGREPFASMQAESATGAVSQRLSAASAVTVGR